MIAPLAPRALWQGLTLRELVNAAMVSNPSDELFIDLSLDGQKRSFSARHIDHISARIARRFSTAGAKYGDPILIAMPNGVPAFLALLGALGAGLKPCLVAPTLSPHAMALVLERVKPRALVSMVTPDFDPLSHMIEEARRLTMPLYVWNFGPSDHPIAAPLFDLFETPAPLRMAPLHPPHQGDGEILTIIDRGAGPEPVIHQQDHLLAMAVLAQMTRPAHQSLRFISAVSLHTQAGLVLGPLRALLQATPIILIADPHCDSFRQAADLDAAEPKPAEWILPQALASRWQEPLKILSGSTLTTLYRAGLDRLNPSDANGMIAFGEAIILPLMRHGQALGQGPIKARLGDSDFHFATLHCQDDQTFVLSSEIASHCKKGDLATPFWKAARAPNGQFIRFTRIRSDQHHGG